MFENLNETEYQLFKNRVDFEGLCSPQSFSMLKHNKKKPSRLMKYYLNQVALNSINRIYFETV
ncbi:MAG: hypothetical protein LBN95_00580 [Prevotellaceae bacterium]|jgi:hypothetical protein|nr:hypothetical protein [Prevotellaceae bacterium]